MSLTENNSPTKEVFDSLLELFNSKKFDELKVSINELLKKFPKIESLGAYNLGA